MGYLPIQNETPASTSYLGGMSGCWRVLRRFCCTIGWYPLWVAPVITAGCLLSLYSSSGCRFVDLNVGFTPNNAAWNTSRAELGLFYYHANTNASSASPTAQENSGGWHPFGDVMQHECVWYTDAFQAAVIDKDRTWRVARIMAMIAVGSSFLASLTAWLVVVLPVPIFCVWPGILLPNTMLAFIAEGSKFLFFDIALCRNAVWFPSGVDSWPEEAESCSLHTSAYSGIVAAVLHLIALLSICLHVPKKRALDPDFGLRRTNTGSNVPTPREIDTDRTDHRRNTTRHLDDEDPSILDEDMYTAGPSPASSNTILKQYTADYDDVEPGSTSQDDSSEPVYEYEEPSSSSSDSSPTNISASRLEAFSRMNAASSERDPSQERKIAELLTDLNKALADSPHD